MLELELKKFYPSRVPLPYHTVSPLYLTSVTYGPKQPKQPKLICFDKKDLIVAALGDAA